jgi:chromosome segregation ATPase
MSIKVKEIESGFAVYFPFALKDNFKSTFKSAKWNRLDRRWEVGPRSKKRLDQWIEAATPAAEDIEESESAELNSKQFEALQAEIAQVRAEISRTRRAKEDYTNTADVLAEAKEELKKVQKELDEEKQRSRREYKEAEALLKKACDINSIFESQEIMKKNWGTMKGKNRDSFKEAQRVIRKERERLESIGFISVGIEELLDLNFNRPDRDNPDVSVKSIFTLRKI